MECPSCRKAIPDGDLFCTYCGQPLRVQQAAQGSQESTVADSSPAPPPRWGRLPLRLPLLAMLGLAVLAAMGLGGYRLWNSGLIKWKGPTTSATAHTGGADAVTREGEKGSNAPPADAVAAAQTAARAKADADAAAAAQTAAKAKADADAAAAAQAAAKAKADADAASYVRSAGNAELVSVSSSGEKANGHSSSPSISGDGRYVAFSSDATNLVAGDKNGVEDVFVRDRQTGTTTRVSVSSTGEQGNSRSWLASISADGRYVAFSSDATTLVAGGTNGVGHVYVRDRQSGTTTRVSVTSTGEQGNGRSFGPSISRDGRYVAYSSDATNLVAGGTNGVGHVYVHDRLTGTTTRVSVSSTGEQGNWDSWYPSTSGDGRYVAFSSQAKNLVAGESAILFDTFVRDRQTGTTTRVAVSSTGEQGNGDSPWHNMDPPPSISGDGRYVAFSSGADNLAVGDTNGAEDMFVRDRQTGTTTRVSVSSTGEQGNGDSLSPSISEDGRYVAFLSKATNLVAGDTNGYRAVIVVPVPGSGGH